MTSQDRIKRIDGIIAGYKAGPFYVNLPNGKVVHEWKAFQMGKKVKLKLQQDEFASVKGGDEFIKRGLLDMPNTLFWIFKRQLTEDEWKWFESEQGKLWIAKHYSVLRYGEKL